jgi:hypothetical protein
MANDLTFLRLIIDGYQGTCVPLNRTSLRALFDEIEALRKVADPARRLNECVGDDWQEIMQEISNAAESLD